MFNASKLSIHGHDVLAWAETEIQSTGPCGIVLVEIQNESDPRKEWVTSWYRSGEDSWSSGTYFHDLSLAWKDFLGRVAGRVGI